MPTIIEPLAIAKEENSWVATQTVEVGRRALRAIVRRNTYNDQSFATIQMLTAAHGWVEVVSADAETVADLPSLYAPRTEWNSEAETLVNKLLNRAYRVVFLAS